MKCKALILALASLLMGVAAGQHGVTQEIERAADPVGFWEGGSNYATESFTIEGPLEITLGAWCFEGIGFVRAVLFDGDGEEAGRVTVIGEGIEKLVLDTEPGEYRLEVVVSHMHIYSWQVQVAAVDPALPLEGDEAAKGASDFVSSESGGIDIPYAWEGSGNLRTELFEASGVLQLTLGAWSSGVQSLVRATVYEADGSEVGSLTVEGGGVRSDTLTVRHGEYYLAIWSPDMGSYSWELVAQAAGSHHR